MHRQKTTRGQSKRTLVVYEKYLLQKYLISAIPYAGIVSVFSVCVKISSTSQCERARDGKEMKHQYEYLKIFHLKIWRANQAANGRDH
jgi:hypothetical protein